MSENDNATSEKKSVGELEESYNEMAKKAEEQHPGISDLLALYGGLQESLKASQEYLQFYSQRYSTTNSNSSTL